MLLEYVFLFVLGLVFGSFISAISYRIPRNISFVKGRSICPKCKSQISWYDNIPLFSYVFLWGKCRHCKKRISLRYPSIELATALVFIFTFKGFTLQGAYSILTISTLAYSFIIFVILLTIFVIDLEKQIIPDSLVFFGMIISSFYLLFFNSNYFFSNIFAGFLAALSLLLIHLVTKGHGMGLGDVKFAILGGMFIGLRLAPIWLFLAFLTGGIIGSILILFGKAKMKTEIAFGPFLIAGLFLVLLFGEKVINFLRFV